MLLEFIKEAVIVKWTVFEFRHLFQVDPDNIADVICINSSSRDGRKQHSIP